MVYGDEDEENEESEEELEDADGTGESDESSPEEEQTGGATGEEPGEEDESEEEAEPSGGTSAASAGKDHQGAAPESSRRSTRPRLSSHGTLVDPDSRADDGSSESDYDGQHSGGVPPIPSLAALRNTLPCIFRDDCPVVVLQARGTHRMPPRRPQKLLHAGNVAAQRGQMLSRRMAARQTMNWHRSGCMIDLVRPRAPLGRMRRLDPSSGPLSTTHVNLFSSDL